MWARHIAGNDLSGGAVKTLAEGGSMSARLVGFGSAAILAAIMFLPASASAGPAGFVNLSADVSVIQNVGYEKRHWRRYHRDYDDDDDGPAYVRAPFTE